ncbi:probable linoleate 9S-lipoxygenase 5 [Papaver somniferum]|uniref:probable linoleate 9S-lipoxygenase 5 n=1 Tax=Papaver somniferum TaxID=3469 RepID=UPI000E6F9FB1|nr:probable linoleate 9S-lipoxygenase 5 [Papaver somniferum]
MCLTEVFGKCLGLKEDERDNDPTRQTVKVKGTVVLMKKNTLDMTDYGASILDRVHELCGKGVCLQLISSDNADPDNGMQGKVGKEAYLEEWVKKITSLTAGLSEFHVTFEWDESIGTPGAFFIKNFHHSEFFLKTLVLEDVPGCGPIHFVCNSWVYPSKHYKQPRIFFSNQSYLTSKTPEPLRKYREDELKILRGEGYQSGELQAWDRVYDYAVYNDLGTNRPVLGNSAELPYPRRGKTGRKPTKKDPNYETRMFLLNLNIYVPRDEKFSQLKFSDFLAYAVKAVGQVIRPEIKAIFDKTPNEFDTFDDVLHLYEGYQGRPKNSNLLNSSCGINLQLIKEVFRSDGAKPLKFPKPEVIQADEFAWRTDEEFGREMLAGVNPVSISRLKEFPPTSTLDPVLYGDHTSSITEEHIEKNLNGMTVKMALEKNKLFILDHHDELIPYLNRINTTGTKTYATRTLLLLQDDGALKPLAIELSLVHPDGEIHGAYNEVYTPVQEGVEGSIWQLAKAYAAVNDSGVHQLISHWLLTHAVIEPFIIATNRHLSALHPIYKLLQPHYRDTMNINALARHILINADGFVERTVFPSKFAMEMSATIYKGWNFTEQALPQNLLKRGIAVEDSSKPHGLRLLIEDYPFAVDGLEIWSAIEKWVHEYCSFYYPSDDLILGDTELQSWWEDLRTQGHGDLKDEPWWPNMQTLSELTQSCTTIIWIASALHAAVNFGQYPYAGYLPNRPTMSRRFMPKRGEPEYDELEKNPDAIFLKTITSQLQTLLGVSLIEILSKHSADEIFLGQRDCPDHWTKDTTIVEEFKRFGEKLVKIENTIMEMNNDEQLKNRVGPVKMPYTLLCPYPLPTDTLGLTGRGIPNSVSI